MLSQFICFCFVLFFCYTPLQVVRLCWNWWLDNIKPLKKKEKKRKNTHSECALAPNLFRSQSGSLLWLLTLGCWWGEVETEAFFSFLRECVLWCFGKKTKKQKKGKRAIEWNAHPVRWGSPAVRSRQRAHALADARTRSRPRAHGLKVRSRRPLRHSEN